MDVGVEIDPELLPKSNRLHVREHYMTLGQPGITAPLKWDFNKYPKFLQFLGYWLAKGYYEKYAVVLATGKDLKDLIDSFDEVSQLFGCNFKIRENKVVKFDSTMLKYVMLGLGFRDVDRYHQKFPDWVSVMSVHNLRDFLKGFMTGCCKFSKDRLLVETGEITALLCLLQIFKVYPHFKDNHLMEIPSSSLITFREQIGFISERKKIALDQLILLQNL